MDFTLDETQQEIAGLAADILRREVDAARPAGEGGYDEQVWRALGKAGLLSLALPPELGGAGLGAVEVAVLLTELGRAAAPVPALTLALGVLPLEFLGTPDQRAALLPEVATGDVLVTAAVHEPSAPLVAKPSTQAVAEAGGWALTGVKTGVPFPNAFTSGSQWAFWVCVGLAAAGLVGTIALVRREELATVETEMAAA